MNILNNKVFKIKIHTIIFILIYFVIIKIHAIPQVLQQVIKLSSLFIAFLYFFNHFEKIFLNKGILLPLIFIIPTIKEYFIGNIDSITFLEGILNSLCFLIIYLSTYYSNKAGISTYFLSLLYRLTVLSCFISIISVIINGSDSGTNIEYFFGNKYATCYLFILLICLTYKRFYNISKRGINKFILLMLCATFAILIAYLSKCYTALIAFIVMIILIIFSNYKIKKFLSQPIVAIISMILPGIIALNMVTIMQISFIQRIITVGMGKTIGLTGRTYIYSKLNYIFTKKPIFGYGYNSDIVLKITEVGNAQNGIMELLINYGLTGVIITLLLVFYAFKYTYNIDEYWGFKIGFYVFCVFSITEISFNYIFFLIIYIMFSSKNSIRR